MFIVKRIPNSLQRISAITNSRKPGEKLAVQAWIQNIRRLKNNIFLDVNDGTTCKKLQVVVAKNDQTKSITWGSSIRATGCIQIAPNGDYELHADDIELIANGNLAKGYPFSPKQNHPPEYVREHLHLRSRVNYIAAAMRVRHKVQKAIHNYMDEGGFVQVNTPILTINDCEGAGEVFVAKPESESLLKEMNHPNVPVDESFFDQRVYLTVSGQLHLEAMSYGLGNTYTLSPAFRAENSKSPLHLSEFHMLEAELVFIEHLSELTAFLEQMIKEVTHRVVKESAEDLRYCNEKALGKVIDFDWLQKPWTTVSYDEASDIVEKYKKKFKTKTNPNDGFSKEQELFLVNHCASPVFIVDWPMDQKPFYMRAVRDKVERVSAFDLLLPVIGELCGGSLREDDYKRLSRHPKFPQNMEWYLELRKYGGLPTAGFGMGFERYLQLLTGFKNIRDVIAFPRYPHSCKM